MGVPNGMDFGRKLGITECVLRTELPAKTAVDEWVRNKESDGRVVCWGIYLVSGLRPVLNAMNDRPMTAL